MLVKDSYVIGYIQSPYSRRLKRHSVDYVNLIINFKEICLLIKKIKDCFEKEKSKLNCDE